MVQSVVMPTTEISKNTEEYSLIMGSGGGETATVYPDRGDISRLPRMFLKSQSKVLQLCFVLVEGRGNWTYVVINEGSERQSQPRSA